MKQYNLVLILLVYSLLAGCQQAVQIDGLPFRQSAQQGWGIINNEGKIIVPAGEYAKSPSAVINGRYTVETQDSFLLLYDMHHPQEPVIPKKFVQIGYFFDNITVAQERKNSPLLLIDRNGQTVSVLDYPSIGQIVKAHNFSDGRALIMTSENKYGYIDTQGKLIIPPIYSEASDFNEGKALVGIQNESGGTGIQVIDTKGKVLFALQHHNNLYANCYSDELLLSYSQDTKQWSYLDGKGYTQLYLPDSISGALPFEKGAAIITTPSGFGLINHKGETVLPPHYRDIQIVGKNQVALYDNKKWSLYNWKEKKIILTELDTIPVFLTSSMGIIKTNNRYYGIKRNNQKEKEGYLHIIMDAAALEKVPQIFNRFSTSVTMGKNSAETKSSLSNKHIEFTQQEKAIHNNHKKENIQLPQTALQISSTDWKKVSKSSPFYKEAMEVISGKLEEKDATNRTMILDYVEHFRTSYTTRDIDFLNQLFSENALIIVGRMIYSSPQQTDGKILQSQVKYSIKSKKEYLDRLREVFHNNQNINLEFSDFRIVRHPSLPDIYGVTLHQKYSSDSYSDDGYLFLLWDFRDRTAPTIHVRTWQPGLKDDQTPLSASEIININQFNLN